MELSNLAELAASRQPIFWAATAAIALGSACLTASFVLLLRRLRPRRHRPQTAAGGRQDETAAADTPAIRAATARASSAADRYEPLQPVRAAASADAQVPSLALLLRRLQAAGDRLDDIVADLDHAASFDPESLLKDALPDVEYVFKASGS